MQLRSASLSNQVQGGGRTRSLVFMGAELVVGDRVVATANGMWKTLDKK
jgi:hypothetical protein